MSATRTLSRRPVNPGAAAKRVMVIKLSALGDFMLALGAIKAVREAHPAAQITLLTTPPFKSFADKCPYVDVVETDGRPDGVRATRDLIGRIRKQKFDIIYDFQTSGRTANYFKALNLPGRKPPLWSGHAPNSAFAHTHPDRGQMHSIDRLAQQLEIAGLAPDGGYAPDEIPMPDFSWIPAALNHRPSLTPAYFGLDGDFAMIIPGASEKHPEKRWPAEHFAAVARPHSRYRAEACAHRSQGRRPDRRCHPERRAAHSQPRHADRSLSDRLACGARPGSWSATIPAPCRWPLWQVLPVLPCSQRMCQIPTRPPRGARNR